VESPPLVRAWADRLGQFRFAPRAGWGATAVSALQTGDVPDPQDLPAETHGTGMQDTAFLRRPALLGLVAIIAIIIGASQPTSPFALKTTGAWFFGLPGPGASTGGLLLGMVTVYGGMLLLVKVWYDLARQLARRPGVRVRSLAIVGAIWILPLLLAPPLFSRDVYSYAAQGEMISHHISPYLYGPNVLGASPYNASVDPFWGNSPAPYGPLFLGLDGGLVNLVGHRVLATVVGLRLMAVAGVGLVAWFIPRLARAYGRDPAQAFLLAVLNPVTLLHLVGGAHNDALMIGLLVAGVTLAKEGRPLVGIILCSLATAVKVPAAVGVVYIGWEWIGSHVSWRERVRPVVTAAIASVAVMAGLSAITGLGWGWLWALGTPGTVRSVMAPVTDIGELAGALVHLAGLGISGTTVLTVVRVLGLAGAAGIGLLMLWNSERLGSLKAMAITLLAFVWLAPVVQAWYVAWGLVLLAPVAAGRLRSLLIALAVGVTLFETQGGAPLLDGLHHSSTAALLLAAVVLAIIPGTPVAHWARRAWARSQARNQWRSAVLSKRAESALGAPKRTVVGTATEG